MTYILLGSKTHIPFRIKISLLWIRNKQKNRLNSLYDEHEPSNPIENDESRQQQRLLDEFWSNMTELELTKGSLTHSPINFFSNRSKINEKILCKWKIQSVMVSEVLQFQSAKEVTIPRMKSGLIRNNCGTEIPECFFLNLIYVHWHLKTLKKKSLMNMKIFNPVNTPSVMKFLKGKINWNLNWNLNWKDDQKEV